MRPPHALCFDLDGTLLDGSRLQESIVRTCEMIAANEPGLDAARMVAANGEIWPGYWREVEEKWTLGALDGASVSLEAWRLTLRACGCGDESIAWRAARIHWRLGREAHQLFDDVLDLFTALKQARVALALITNGASDTQRDKLRVLGIEPWFDAVVISGEVGIAKPDASVFGLAIDKLAVERDNVWHVGDSLATDVAGAQAAGLTAVWLNRRGLVRKECDPKPDLEIHSLSDLIGLPGRMNR
ncbi:MAG TPA: HAD family hydrolase [Candidatus Binataceae bacterium]|nr:HAD family hydrolase [Candidatus Binataceae bacterium]